MESPHSKKRRTCEQSAGDEVSSRERLFSRSFVAQLLDQCGDSVLVVEDGRVLLANCSFSEYVFSADELAQLAAAAPDGHWQSFPFFLDSAEEQFFCSALRQCLADGKRRTISCRLPPGPGPGWNRTCVTLSLLGPATVCCIFAEFDRSLRRKFDRFISENIALGVSEIVVDQDVRAIWRSAKNQSLYEKTWEGGQSRCPDGFPLASSLNLKPETLQRRIQSLLSCGTGTATMEEQTGFAVKGADAGDDDWRCTRLTVSYAGLSEKGNPVYFRFVEDVTDRRRAEMNLAAENAKNQEALANLRIFRDFFENAPVLMGVIRVMDDDIEYKFGNQATAALIGKKSVEDIPGARSSERLSPDVLKMMIDYYRGAINTAPNPHRFTVAIGWKSKERLHMSIAAKYLGDDLYVYVAEDVTDRRALEDSLRRHHDELEAQVVERTAKLEEALAVKSRFLSIMSHEIRTPLGGVTSTVSLLLNDRTVKPEHRELLHIAKVCSEQLMHVINDILELSRLEFSSTEMLMECVPFSPERCVEEALEIVSFNASKQDVELVADIEPSLQETVSGDPGRLRQILVNLLGNACKFSKSGRDVVVTAGSSRLDDGRAELSFSVQDAGIGIPHAAQAAVFQPFHQADQSTSRRFGGSGLGLSISKRLAELMHGRIWFESEEGVGSTFHVTLQVECSAPRSAPSAQPALPHGGRTPSLILALQSAGLRRALRRLAASSGWAVHDAASIDDALLTSPPLGTECHAVFADLNDVSPAVLERMHAAWPAAAAVVLGWVRPSDPMPGAQFLKKPVRVSFVRNLLAQWSSSLRDPNSSGVVPSMPIHTASFDWAPASEEVASENGVEDGHGNGMAAVEDCSPPKEPSLNPLRILVAEDNVLNQIVIRKMLDAIGRFDIVMVSDGRQAVVALSEQTFSLVLMDVMMPGQNGLEATREIRASGSVRPQPPIIAVTANAFSDDRQQCLDAGMDDVITKPLQRRQLVDVLNRFLGAKFS